MSSEQVSGANIRIAMGEFGEGVPILMPVDPRVSGLYFYHEGDLFSPGTGNWVFEPTTELPLVTVWGRGFLRKPNTFNPVQPPQVMARPTLRQSGIGGLQAGGVALEPLLIEEF